MKNGYGLVVVVAALLLGATLLAAACGSQDSAALVEDPGPEGGVSSDLVLADSDGHIDEHDDADGAETAMHDEDADGHDGAEAAIHEDDHDNGHDADVVLHDDHDAVDGDIVEITLKAVEGGHWGFDPDVIEVRLGQRVRLTLLNDGNAEHDVEIAGLLADHIQFEGGGAGHEAPGGGHHDAELVAAHAMPGTTASVMFTPLEAGEFEFVCTLPGHKEAGMAGKIIVTSDL